MTRYLWAKRAWLERRRPDITHSLVVPGPATRQAGPGLVTVAAARLPFGDGYRMPASVPKWEAVLRLLAPDIIEAGDILTPGRAALAGGTRARVVVKNSRAWRRRWWLKPKRWPIGRS